MGTVLGRCTRAIIMARMGEDAEEIALRLLEQLEQAAYRRAAAKLVRAALEQSKDAPVVVETVLEIVEDPDAGTWARSELAHVLVELGERSEVERIGARCLVAAAGLLELTEDRQVALAVVIAALRRDPDNRQAREQFEWMAEEPDEAPVYADAMERLAQEVAAGSYPREAFEELLRLAAPLGDELDSARAILTRA